MTAAHLPRPPMGPAVFDLLGRSHLTLESACRTSDVAERFRDAHLGALRAAAALVAARSVPSPRSRPRSVWQVLPRIAPELGEWATFFADCSTRRSAIDRGEPVSVREADDLLRQAEMFLEIVQDCLGVPATMPLPQSITPVSPLVTGQVTGQTSRLTVVGARASGGASADASASASARGAADRVDGSTAR